MSSTDPNEEALRLKYAEPRKFGNLKLVMNNGIPQEGCTVVWGNTLYNVNVYQEEAEKLKKKIELKKKHADRIKINGDKYSVIKEFLIELSDSEEDDIDSATEGFDEEDGEEDDLELNDDYDFLSSLSKHGESSSYFGSFEPNQLVVVKDIPKPPIKDDEILIKSVAGVIEDVGSKVQGFAKGDTVSTFITDTPKIEQPSNLESTTIQSFEGAASVNLGLYYGLTVVTTASQRTTIVSKIQKVGKIKFALDIISTPETFQKTYEATENSPEVYLDSLSGLDFTLVKEKDVFNQHYVQTPELIKDFEKWCKKLCLNSLGNGSFGTVELAKFNSRSTLLYPLEDSKCNLSNLVAIKTMKKKLPLLLEYANVKEIYEMFIDDIQYQLHISMEALNQNLYQLIRSRRNIKFSPVTLKSILSQLLCAIRHIHKWNYFIVTHVSNTKPYTAYVSTRWYRSPEILLRQKWYSRPIDIWAFGAVAVEIANFVPLFPGSNEFDQIWKILRILGSPYVPEPNTINANYVVPLGGYWNDAVYLANKLGLKLPAEPGMNIEDVIQHPDANALQDVIQGCLKWDPIARADANELAKMPYFKETIAMMDSHFESESLSVNATLNKKLMVPAKTQRNVSTLDEFPIYQDLDDGYENYFDEYIGVDQGEKNSEGNDGYKLISRPWMTKVKDLIGTRESFTTFSMESEEVANL
ncbi:Meiosis induction protein kinase IME2/SME1 [Candida viswanathii]|uniref:Meiosis induction protein kinase IME2/SME1 n=1 Tax=Candida viswanathii TaxID=5486 RepID=A0A367YLT1_9ASCO|nr:Meiosis induction protein kinase IME2/SME1 [Candida viswanathii]